MTLPSPSLGRSFGVLLGVSLVAACSGSAFTGKAGREDLDTRSSAAAGIGGGAETGPAELGGTATGGHSPARVGTGGSGGKAPTLEPFPEGGGTPDVGGTAGTDVGGTGGSAGGGEGGSHTKPEPEPGCDAPIHDQWDAALGSGSGGWRVEFGDPRVDLAQHQLVVSYDDVATRNDELEGGYVMAADVTFSGYTVLTPYPYVWEVTLPSLRRNAQGTGIELGATSYGTGNAWRTDLFPGFGGVTLAGTTKAHVTSYVQAESQQLAIKVEAGEKVYRSGWLDGFTWKDTNLNVFRFVGENNSSTYGGDSDELRIGQVDGCQKLSDADVLKRYSE